VGRVTAVAVGAALAVAGCVSVPFPARVENAVVFQPVPHPVGIWVPDPGVEDVWFESADGTRLHGWFAEADRPRAVVLFAHGNAGNVTFSREAVRRFRRLDCSVLALDYRGYGRSDGTPTEAGVLADARAARRWVAARAGVAEADVVLAGHSLGGGVVVDLAAADGARGLILEGTFTSLPDVARSWVPLLPYQTLMRNRLDSVAKIPAYTGPLLQAHGDADRVVPFALGRKLFAAANAPKEFVRVPGGGHNDPPRADYLLALDRFMAALPPPAGR
jgi:fermentation-respiration switch protein FrsA (DUF1100 family)